MSCPRSGQSLVGLLVGMTSQVNFMATSTILCTSNKVTESGSDYVAFHARCTSSTGGQLNKILLRDSGNTTLLEIVIPAVNVSQGWTLYAYIRLRWV